VPAAARDVEHQVEQLPAELLDGRVAGRDAAGVDVHQVVPAPRQLAPRCDLDHRHRCQPVGRAAASGEHVTRHARRKLQRAADEIAGRRRGIEQTLAVCTLAGRHHPRNGRGAGFDDRAHCLLGDVRQSALLISRRSVGAAVDAAAPEIAVVPAELGDQCFRDLRIGTARGELGHAVAHLGVLREL
jgi:hypothetical protein